MRIPQILAQQAPSGFINGGRAATSAPDVSGLVRGVEVAADAFEEKQREQDKTRAMEKLSTAQLEWTQSEVERRRTYDPAVTADFTADTIKAFDEHKEKVLASGGSPYERKLMQERLLGMRHDVATRAIGYEAQARADYRRGSLGKTLDTRMATAQLDPTQANDLIAQQVAEIQSSDQLSVVERREMSEAAKGALAYAAMQSLATTAPQALRDHPLLALVPADKLPGLFKLGEKANQLTAAQQTADGIMARGLPMDEAMRLIEKDHQGEDERLIKAEVASRYSYTEAARRDAEDELYGTAQLEVEQRGKVTPATWAKLTDGHRAAILNRQQAEARQRRAEAASKPVKTDWALYLSLRQQAFANPKEFAKVDLVQYVDKIGPGQLEQLADIQLKPEKPQAQAKAKEAATLTQQMNATMKALNIRTPRVQGQFLSYVQTEVDAAMQDKGKPLTFEERQQIIDRAVLQGPDPDRILPWGDKRMFQLTPEQRARFVPEAATDAPATEIDDLNEALKEQGLPLTPANRLRLYQRVVGNQQ